MPDVMFIGGPADGDTIAIPEDALTPTIMVKEESYTRTNDVAPFIYEWAGTSSVSPERSAWKSKEEKMLAFASIYGMGPKKIADQFGVSATSVEAMREAFYAAAKRVTQEVAKGVLGRMMEQYAIEFEDAQLELDKSLPCHDHCQCHKCREIRSMKRSRKK
jgi:hypothetical protein